MTVLLEENKDQRSEVQETWTSGPSIQATFHTKKSSIIRISLTQAGRFSCCIRGSFLQDEIFEWMDLYSQGKRGKLLPLHFDSFTPFMQRGLLAISKIPFGETKSYQEVAALARQAKGARAIGNVCNKNPYPLVIPCHRVVQGNGSIGGFAYPIEMKRSMLEFESLTLF